MLQRDFWVSLVCRWAGKAILVIVTQPKMCASINAREPASRLASWVEAAPSLTKLAAPTADTAMGDAVGSATETSFVEL